MLKRLILLPRIVSGSAIASVVAELIFRYSPFCHSLWIVRPPVDFPLSGPPPPPSKKPAGHFLIDSC